MSTLLIQALQDAQLYPHEVHEFRMLETHISWVLLTGSYAYKIKKPVNLGFLDFSTLAQRRYFCDEELRLNRRFAPQLYLEVVTIHGTPQQPRFADSGPVIEYAVKMLQFEQQNRVDALLANNQLGIDDIGRFALDLAALHAQAPCAPAASAFGTAQTVWAPMAENFTQLRALGLERDNIVALEKLEQWSRAEFAHQQQELNERKRAGYVRECHGDLHTRNLVRIGAHVAAFDCLEFNAGLRWIDVLNEVAFLLMDLEACGQPAFAWRFLNSYLEASGGYAGVRLLPLYLTYRALVRAKVAGLQARPEAHVQFQQYFSQAQRYITPAKPVLAIMQGLSGSGKSTLSQQLADRLGLIRVRSDVERKRMFACAPQASGDSGLDKGLYAAAATDAVYQHLAALAETLLTAGFSAVLDATFLQRAQRGLLRAVAQRAQVPFVIIRCHAPREFLEHAITQRAQTGGDASEADLQVLEHQIAVQQALDGTEIAESIEVDASVSFDAAAVAQQLRRYFAQMSSPGFQ